MQEGTLVRWLKKPGERVERNEPIAEIETDKAVLQIEAFEGGVLAKILVEEGKTVPVGTPIAILNGGAAGDEQAAGTPSPGDGAAEAADAAARRAVAAAQVPPAAAPAQGVAVEPIAEGSDQGGAAAASSAETQSQRIKASPLARRLARERGLDLRSIRGTGPGGRIVKADVEAASAAAAEAPRPAAP